MSATQGGTVAAVAAGAVTLVASLALSLWLGLAGIPTGIHPLGLAVPLAAGLVACAATPVVRGPWRNAALWCAMFALVCAATMELTSTPRTVGYQHYQLTLEDAWDRVALGVVIAQVALLTTIGRRSLAAAVRSLGRGLRVGGIVWIGAIVVLLVAVPSRDPAAYAAEVVVGAACQLLALASVLVAAWSLSDDSAPDMDRWLDRTIGPRGAPGPTRVDRWAVSLAIFSVVVSATLAAVSYENHPHVPDEVGYLLHARYLAAGHLWMSAPPVPAAFNLDLMVYEPTRWFSPVPPGWPFVLALGVRAGVPWLVNPVLGGVAILLAYLVLGGIVERRTTRLTTLLLALSPWFLFMNMSLMTHPLALVAALLGALGVLRARQTGSGWPALLAGLATGFLALVRPLEGLAAAVLLGFWSLGARNARMRLLPSAALVLGTVATGLLSAVYNLALTGSARRAPIMLYVDRYAAPGANDLGFGPNRGLGWSGLDPFPGHGLRDALLNTLLNLVQVNVELSGWATGSAVVLALSLAYGVRHLSRAERWLLAVAAFVPALHALYWFSGGPDFGARYWYLTIVAFAGLVAAALLRAGNGTSASPPANPATARVLAATAALLATALLLTLPWRAASKYYRYRGMRPDVRTLARDGTLGRSLVLVRGRRHPDYASAATYNPLDLQADAPVFAWDASRRVRAEVLAAYAGRPVYILDGPTLTGAGYRLRAGPLTAAQALADSLQPDVAGDTANVRDPVTLRSLRDPVRDR